MRIIIDMQGAQTESRFRGIGRYTLALVQALIRNSNGHEFILVLNGLFPETISPIRSAFSGLLPDENIRVWSSPQGIQKASENESHCQIVELIREAFIASFNPDLVHITSLFEGPFDNSVTSIECLDRITPVSVSFYDLIPLMNPEQYLKVIPGYEKFYRRKLEYLSRASLLLSISESSKAEGVQYLGMCESKITNISTAADAHFCRVVVPAKRKESLQNKIGINRSFLLCVGATDPRKNLPRLIRAYSQISSSLREEHQLVFAGRIPDSHQQQLRNEAIKAGLKSDECIFTGYVTENELVDLYNLCTLFVFPSWHEGFGLPALEAMACGAPVIAANTSSLPEVVGRDDVLFDPFSTKSITEKITSILCDADYRAELIEYGLQQSKKFSWDECARKAIVAFEKLVVTSKKSNVWRTIRAAKGENLHELIAAIANQTSRNLSLDDCEIRQIAGCLASNFKSSEQFLSKEELPKKINWRIEGPFDSSYSLALLNRETALALDEAGHNVLLHSTEGPGDFPANENFLKQHPSLSRMNQLAVEVSAETANVCSRNLYPPRVADMSCRHNFLHHYAWEESEIPSEWIADFNDYLNGITALSIHVQKILVDNGVQIPLSVSGCGVDHWQRVVADRSFSSSGKSFKFLHVSSCFPRKGVDTLLRAYGQEFDDNDDVTLIVKTFKNPHNEIHRWLSQAKQEAKAQNRSYPDIIIIEEDLSDRQLKALYQQCQALVAPSRAEGFGLPMAEAMLSGLPVVTTNWGGQLDFCTHKTSWLVDYDFVAADSHFCQFDSVWAEPVIADLKKKMREVYALPIKERQRKARAGKNLLLKKFRWRNVVERLVNSAREWSQIVDRKQPKIGWLTTWNTRCGIASYSEHLLNAFPESVAVLAAHTTSALGKDSENVTRCWEIKNNDPLHNLRHKIDKLELDTLVIQFNYNFFEFEVLAEFINEQIDAGRVVVVMLHSTTDPVNEPKRKLEIVCPAFARCHRILVHTPSDLNRLKALGLIKNVSIFPHGVLDYPVQVRNDNKSKVFKIFSYGFFLPHKGLLELIDAVYLLRKRGLNVSLSMVNAEYPAPVSAELIVQAYEKIKEYKLEQAIDICVEYLTEQQCLQRLSQADLIIFPYQNTGESSSAAVRYGLSSGRPVMVSPSAIFDDVKQAVHFLSGQTVEDITQGIATFVDGEYNQDVAKNAERWRKAHLFSQVGTRLYGMLVALLNTARSK